MGMYTRLTFWADFTKESPAVPVIQGHMGLGHPISDDPDAHPFLRAGRAWAIFRCSSYYHRTGESQFIYDDIADRWWLNIDSSLKNYEGEIALFLDWVSQYDVGDAGFRGFYLYEEDEHPTLIYREGDAYVERGVQS